MSTFSTGIGLVSGIPIQQLVDSLINVQRRPITQLQARLGNLASRRTAYLQITSQLLGVQNLATRFANTEFFRRSQATSSDESSIVVSAGAGSAVGSFTFSVKQLATTQQMISSGFATADATPVGAGTLTLETAAGRLDHSTSLDALRDGEGIRRGAIRITDRAGGTADIDLASAVTIRDVIERINGQAAARVHATVENDRLVLRDQTGLSVGALTVAEIGNGRTAADLGIAGNSTTGTLTGAQLVFVTDATSLSRLNDGNAVRWLNSQSDFAVTLADGTTLNIDLSPRLSNTTPLSVLNRGAGVPQGSIRISTRSGQQVDVDLSSAATMGDVKTIIEASGAGVTVTLSGARMILNDASSGDQTFKVEEVDGGTTAAALGLTTAASAGTITGKDIFHVETLGDIRRIINHHTMNGGKLLAEISPDGFGLRLIDQTSGSGTFEVTALNNSSAAFDLGLLREASGNVLQSARVIGGLDTVLLRTLNGGSGVGLGQVQIINRAGATAVIDLSNAATLTDVLSAINGAGIDIAASVSDSGLGIVLHDQSGGAGSLSISDLTGTTAADLRIAIDSAISSAASGNLQRQYISEATRLADLNDGRGIVRGRFRITNSLGQSAVVDLTQGNEVTLRDVIDEINSRGIGVVARINDQGDGLLIEDTTTGGGRLRITEDGATTAKSLNILKEAAPGSTTIDGSYETRITITATDTLQNVVDKIRSSGARVSATILRSGGSERPFRLNLVAAQTGRAGALAVDTGTTGLGFETLNEGRDAVVVFGDPNSSSPVVIQNATNSLTNVLEGVRLDLVGISTAPVKIEVRRNNDALAQDLSAFVTAVNNVVSSVDSLSRYDAETQQRGVLNGDTTARRVRDRLLSLVTRSFPGGSATVTRLSQLGITLVSGSSLRFDEQKFRTEYEKDPAAVQAFFTTEATGFGKLLQDEIKGLTDAESGTIALQEQSIRNSEDLLKGRIEQMEKLIDRRRQRLLAQFNATESLIASFQTQQSALSGLSLLSAS